MNAILSKRIGVLVATVLLAAVGCSGSSGKDAAVLGAVAGTVKDSNGAAIAGATVTASPNSGPAATTDSSGKYRLSLPAGSYSVAFAADNYEPATASASVEMGKTTPLDQSLTASALKVTVTLPAALKSGGPSGFNTTVSGITAAVTLNGEPATGTVTWTIKDYYGLVDPAAGPTAATVAGDGSVSFPVVDFETIREGANAWLNARYGTAGTPDEFEYIQAPERDQLLTFGVQQVRAMSYKVIARVTNGSRSATGSAIVSPVTINGGQNMQPLGMMIVANTKMADSYAWTLEYANVTHGAVGGAVGTIDSWGAASAGTSFQGADTKNPTIVADTAGMYRLTSGSNAPLYFRVSTYHGAGFMDTDVAPDDANPDTNSCANCHAGPYALTSKFTEWGKSAHGNFNWKDPLATPAPLFKIGLSGFEGSHYSENCISCHTVGYSKVPSAQNGGFDDVMKSTSWSFPTPPDTFDPTYALWNAMPDALKYRGAIQCENCHGPLQPADHGEAHEYNVPAIFALPLSPLSSMDAGVCLVCHDAFNNHDKGPLWSASPHASMDLVLADAVVEQRGTSAAHCGRCHAGEGFIVYVAQQQAGVASNIARPATLTALTAAPSRPASTNPPATYNARLCTPSVTPVDPGCICGQTADWKAAGLLDPTLTTTWPAAKSNSCYHDPEYYDYLKGIGLSTAKAHSQTCQTCHDPHSTELRVDGNTGVVAAGFNVKGAGAGALCMVCHNSRITAPIYADSDKTSYSAPHVASQGDIFAGRSAYFFGLKSTDTLPAGSTIADYLPNEAAHKFMAETCADCHVAWVPPDLQAQFKPVGTNHTFRTTMEVCAECHASGIGELVAEQVKEKMTTLSNALGLLYRAKLNAGGTDSMDRYALDDAGAISDTKLAAGAIAAGAVQRIGLAEFHGQPALVVTLTDGTVFGNNMGSFKLSAAALFPVSTGPQKIVAKAFYNYLLVHGGAAEGVHNPAFVNGVLDATMVQMNTVSSL